MSTQRVDRIEKRDGSAGVDTNYVVGGTAKAWANFAGQTSSIRESFNVSSLTDHGTGDFSINLTSSMSNTDYLVNSTAGNVSNQHSYVIAPRVDNVNTGPFTGKTAGACRFISRYGSDTLAYDLFDWNTLVHGDLA